MTKAEFIILITEEIEEAIMRAQGIGDGLLGDDTTESRATHIANHVPSYAFSEPDEE